MYWLIQEFGSFYIVKIAVAVPFYGLLLWRMNTYIVAK